MNVCRRYKHAWSAVLGVHAMCLQDLCPLLWRLVLFSHDIGMCAADQWLLAASCVCHAFMYSFNSRVESHKVYYTAPYNHQSIGQSNTLLSWVIYHI